MTLGWRVKARREAAGLSQHELADKTEVSQSYIGTIESGRTKRPSATVLAKLAKFFGITVDELMNGAQLGAATVESAVAATAWPPDPSTLPEDAYPDRAMAIARAKLARLDPDAVLRVRAMRQPRDEPRWTELDWFAAIANAAVAIEREKRVKEDDSPPSSMLKP